MQASDFSHGMELVLQVRHVKVCIMVELLVQLYMACIKLSMPFSARMQGTDAKGRPIRHLVAGPSMVSFNLHDALAMFTSVLWIDLVYSSFSSPR